MRCPGLPQQIRKGTCSDEGGGKCSERLGRGHLQAGSPGTGCPGLRGVTLGGRALKNCPSGPSRLGKLRGVRGATVRRGFGESREW